MGNIIFLVDMNAFFISCEETRHPELNGVAAAVAGDPEKRTGIILSANYIARKRGVKTTMVVNQALKLCPEMVLLPPDHSFYEKKSHEVMNILSDFTPVLEQNSIDEAWLDLTGSEKLFGEPIVMAQKIMDRIKDELGLGCSIGIAENKFLSKMASEMKKPHGITELRKENIEEKLWPLDVIKMYGVGRQTAEKLQGIGIKTIGELAATNKDRLVKKLGKVGSELVLLANGIDPTPVEPRFHGQMKSIGRSVTSASDITDIGKARLILLELSDDIGSTARENNKYGRTVQITIKYSNFQTITRQMTIEETNHTKDIYETAVELLLKSWNRSTPIRLIGISLSGFAIETSVEQISMFQVGGFKNINDNSEKLQRIENTIDTLRQKYGAKIIKPAALIQKKTEDK